jgi:hypothetical protein
MHKEILIDWSKIATAFGKNGKNVVEILAAGYRREVYVSQRRKTILAEVKEFLQRC